MNTFALYFKVNFRGKNFHERGVNHENHENIVPRKFGAIYTVYCINSVAEVYSQCSRFTSRAIDMSIEACIILFQSRYNSEPRDERKLDLHV